MRLNLFLAFIIAALNVVWNYPIFWAGSTPYKGSIERGYAYMARFLSHSPDPWSWNPLQYCGLPTQFVYLPALPYFTAFWISILPWFDPTQIYRVIVAIAACLGPAAVFLFVRTFTASRPSAFGAAILVTFISPLYLLIHTIDNDRGIQQIPWRLQVMVKYGEGPHTVGFVLLLGSLIASFHAAKSKDFRSIFLAAVMMAFTVLTNWVAGLALAICTVLLLLAMAGGKEFERRRVLVAGVLGYALSSFWLTPTFIATMAFNWPQDAFGYKMQMKESSLLLLLFAGLALIRLVFSKLPNHRYLGFLCTCLYAFGLMVACFYNFNINTIPESRRYAMEYEFFLILTFVELVRAAVHSNKWWITWPAMLGMLVTLLWLTPEATKFLSHRWDKWYTTGTTSSVEYQTALKLNQMHQSGRVFVSGGTKFRLNSWFDEPQVGGVFETGLRNRLPVDMAYQIRTDIESNSGQEAENTIWQLRAMAVDLAVIHGPKSAEYYRDFKFPKKLENVLPATPLADDDYLYQVPPSPLAFLIQENEFPMKAPNRGRMRLLEPYINAMDNPARPKLQWQWLANDHLRVTGDIPAGLSVALAVNFAGGWRADQAGTAIPVLENTLGFITLRPTAANNTTIDLHYRAGWEPKSFAAISLAAWIYSILRLRRERQLKT